MSDPWQFARVSANVADAGEWLRWDQLIDAVAQVDLPAKVLAVLSASFFCDDTSIALTEQDCAWYNAHQDELKEVIRAHSSCADEVTISWAALTDRLADVFPSAAADPIWRL